MILFLFGILFGALIFAKKFFVLFLCCFVIMFFLKPRWYFIWLVCGVFYFSFPYLFINELPYGDVQMRGCIVAEPDIREFDARYIFEIDDLKVLLKLPKYPNYKYGDCLMIKGVMKKIENFEDFNYKNYLSIFKVYEILDGVEVLSVEENVSFLRVLFNIKGKFEQRLNKIYSEPYGSFMAGLILGSRRGIANDLMQNFNETGLTHIIAISGYNITLVILAVNFLFAFVPIKKRFWISVFLIFCFVFLVGASASVVRAGIMGSLSLLAIYFGREYFVLRSLFISAFFMAIFNPNVIAYDVGFHLSFLSTLGLVLAGDHLKESLRVLPNRFLIKETFAMTLASQIFTLPVVIINFGRFSLVSILANLFVLPFVPLAMLFGLASVFLGSFFGFFGFLFLEIIIIFVNFFASFPFASIDIPGLPDFIFVFYYIFVCFVFRAKLRSLAN